MRRAELLQITVERFKSFEARTTVDLAPLTVVVGRNNSGKSSLIQTLLLLKQTLAEPRPEVPLHLDGTVNAFNLRELTSGWPEQGEHVPGPTIGLRWACDVDMGVRLLRRNDGLNKVGESLRLPGLGALANGEGIARLVTALEVGLADESGTTVLTHVDVSYPELCDGPVARVQQNDGEWRLYWHGQLTDNASVSLEHFVPRVHFSPIWGRGASANGVSALSRNRILQRVLTGPLDALERLLADFQYLGSTRFAPPALYRASNVAPQDIGASGELAAQLLHRRQKDVVHYLPPLEVTEAGVKIPVEVRERPLVGAVNDVLKGLSIEAPVSIDEIREVGFRVLFGSASLAHVGRGLTYLLPLVELGLFADPLRFTRVGSDLAPDDYRERCDAVTHVAFEEPESHLHPKVQSRLAHWMVSLAMSNRRLIVETHSDHLVRRLRGLVARAGADSELEKWLLENVRIVEVEQGADGRSTVRSSRLTRDGGIGESWPTDFMDEASDEESAIYYARFDKAPAVAPETGGIEFVDDDEPELDESP